MAAKYTYLATDLLTGQVLDELPLHGVTFDRQLNKPGNWQGSGNLDNGKISNESMLGATEPGKTAIYVYREDQIVWGGIIWSRTYQSQAKSLQMTAQTFESFAYKRVFRPPNVINWNNPQCWLIRELWWLLQNTDVNSNIGVNIPALELLPTVDVTRQMTVNPWTFKSYGELIDDPLMNFDNSAEWTIDVYEDLGTPTKVLRIGYPRLGAYIDYTELVIDYPGNILNYYWSESASSGGNRSWATGDGDDGAMVVGSATNQASLDSGYPLLETVVAHQGVTVQSTIDAHASDDLASKPVPRINKTIQIKADQQPDFGTYNIGDDARLQITDSRFPQGIDTTVRVMGWSVTPPSGESVEELQFVLAGEVAEE